MTGKETPMTNSPDADHFMNSLAWASELFAAYGERGIKEEERSEWMLRGVLVAIGIHDARSRLKPPMTITFKEALATGIRLAEQWAQEDPVEGRAVFTGTDGGGAGVP